MIDKVDDALRWEKFISLCGSLVAFSPMEFLRWVLVQKRLVSWQ